MMISKIKSILDRNNVQDSENLANALAEILNPRELSESIDNHKTSLRRMRGDL
ncbi:hypothetical protein [Streptococcus iniae]|uniref:hypothetical protein n=1 Tax=Streptococcus iniae TaxID=1346 RepID=UPI0003348025|nr:hypothetical protein [Streptococcus iniae]AGM98651.1 hypothetical protein K710_0877 [Streptococcus iniae SF1]QBX16688.1 hypothetical protein Javan271_0008 [Streptococcus phage Javan271]WLR88549.1 hypothetical protein Q9317_04410 [Streptococcus iniae]